MGQCATPVPVLGKARDVPFGEVDAVRAPHVAGEPAELCEVLDRRASVQLLAVRVLLARLREVRVEDEAEAAGELGGFAHEPSCDGER